MQSTKNPLDGLTRRAQFQGGLMNPRQHSPSGVQNRIRLEVWSPRKPGEDGASLMKRRSVIEKIGNMLATNGLDRLAELIATGGEASTQWVNAMAIGTHTTAESSTATALGASTQRIHLSQASMNVSDVGSRTVRWVGTFASDGNASEIHEIGLEFTTTAAQTLIARSELGTDSVNRGASDEIRVSYDSVFTTA